MKNAQDHPEKEVPQYQGSAFYNFVRTIARLRGPDGCPWDREQTHQSLARYLLEETYEVLEAIHNDNMKVLREELGDLLLQIVLHAQLAEDEGHFQIDDVARDIDLKMVRRHPHVFGDASLKSSKEVVSQWDELKEHEKKRAYKTGSLLSDIPSTLPALLQALKISERAVSQGFEWAEEDQVWQQLHSELVELKQALAEPESPSRRRAIELEMGDVLFTMVNIARWHDFNPEEALLLAIDKFKQRFFRMEHLAEKPLKELTTDEWESLWQKAKAGT